MGGRWSRQVRKSLAIRQSDSVEMAAVVLLAAIDAFQDMIREGMHFHRES
jgi:hypothetical protein